MKIFLSLFLLSSSLIVCPVLASNLKPSSIPNIFQTSADTAVRQNQKEKQESRKDETNLQINQQEPRENDINLQISEQELRKDETNELKDEQDLRKNEINLQASEQELRKNEINLQIDEQENGQDLRKDETSIQAYEQENLLENLSSEYSIDIFKLLTIQISPKDRLALACACKRLSLLSEIQDISLRPFVRFYLRNACRPTVGDEKVSQIPLEISTERRPNTLVCNSSRASSLHYLTQLFSELSLNAQKIAFVVIQTHNTNAFHLLLQIGLSSLDSNCLEALANSGEIAINFVNLLFKFKYDIHQDDEALLKAAVAASNHTLIKHLILTYSCNVNVSKGALVRKSIELGKFYLFLTLVECGADLGLIDEKLKGVTDTEELQTWFGSEYSLQLDRQGAWYI